MPVDHLMFPLQVKFGEGAIRVLGKYFSERGITRVLVVTDPGVRKAGIVDIVIDQLLTGNIECEVFDGAHENPTDDNVYEGIEVYRKGKFEALVAVGGGSPMDAAKGIQLLASHPGKLDQYCLANNGADKIKPDLPPLVAVPTTAGTGSEVSIYSVITHSEDNVKRGYASPYLIPTLALIDPELMATMPPKLTAATGMDALCHCIESYVSKLSYPPANALALEGARLIAGSLERAVSNGRDMRARADMAMGSMLGAMAFNLNSLGAVHSLAHQLSTVVGLPHGVANAIMLPPVMEFNLGYAQSKYAELGRIMTGERDSDDSAMAARAVEYVRQLSKTIRIPESLRSVGVEEKHLQLMAHNGYAIDVNHLTNPRPCSEEDFLDLYRQVF